MEKSKDRQTPPEHRPANQEEDPTKVDKTVLVDPKSLRIEKRVQSLPINRVKLDHDLKVVLELYLSRNGPKVQKTQESEVKSSRTRNGSRMDLFGETTANRPFFTRPTSILV